MRVLRDIEGDLAPFATWLLAILAWVMFGNHRLGVWMTWVLDTWGRLTIRDRCWFRTYLFGFRSFDHYSFGYGLALRWDMSGYLHVSWVWNDRWYHAPRGLWGMPSPAPTWGTIEAFSIPDRHHGARDAGNLTREELAAIIEKHRPSNLYYDEITEIENQVLAATGISKEFYGDRHVQTPRALHLFEAGQKRIGARLGLPK